MEGAVYLLCAATALLCAGLLLWRYRRSGARLLVWCGLCFLGLALENLALFVDIVLVPEVDLSAIHLPAALAGVLVLLYGLVWENP